MTAVINDEQSGSPAPVRRPRFGRRALILIGIAVVVLAGGAIAGTKVAFRYAHAAALWCTCASGWATSEPHAKDSSAADWYQSTATASTTSTPRRHAFYLEITNDAPVTQTVLGLPAGGGGGAQKGRLQVATERPGMGLVGARWRPAPLAVPPGGIVGLRYSFLDACISKGGEMYYTDVMVRVRVGWFTRVETIGIGHQAFAVRGTAASRRTCH